MQAYRAFRVLCGVVSLLFVRSAARPPSEEALRELVK